jgi:hypothetical protein
VQPNPAMRCHSEFEPKLLLIHLPSVLMCVFLIVLQLHFHGSLSDRAYFRAVIYVILSFPCIVYAFWYLIAHKIMMLFRLVLLLINIVALVPCLYLIGWMLLCAMTPNMYR